MIKKIMLKLYNTLSRKKEAFIPRKSLQIGMYICGPTVYGPGHIGHAKTYISFDIIRRYLEYKNYNVKFIINITDIHDDIIRESKKLKTPFLNLAGKYAKLFLKELDLLGIKKANRYPRVTKHIREIIGAVEKLVKKGAAYEERGSVYFDISKFKDYGKLSGIKLKKALTGTRVKTDKYEREEAADFVLWKTSSVGEPGWKSQWGKGRPGWHIECSVMSQKYLGKQIDIHGGAKDLVFPHHENEIAQSESLTSKTHFVKYWLHSGLLTVRGKKMAKSLKNYITIDEALKRWEARALRLFVLMSHYRSPQDFNEKTLKQAQKGIERIDEFLEKLRSFKKLKKPNRRKIHHDENISKTLVSEIENEFEKAMDDDFNTPVALAAVFKLINRGNTLLAQGNFTLTNAKNILKFLRKIDKIFNIIFWKKLGEGKIPESILKLVQERKKYRQKGNWKASDEVRGKIKDLGYWVEDTKKGPKIKRINQ